MTRVEIYSGQYLKTGDTEPDLDVQLIKDNGAPKDLANAGSVAVHLAEPEGEIVQNDDTNGNVSIEDASNGRVTYSWDAADTEVAQTLVGEFVVTDSDSEESTYPNRGVFQIYIEEGLA